MNTAGVAAASACALVGVGVLRWSWGHSTRRPGRSALGWLVLCAGAFAWHGAGAAADKAVALAALIPSSLALALLAGQALWLPDPGLTRRQRRVASQRAAQRAPAPPGPSGSGLAVRIALAGPLALVTALALTALTARRAPWAEADRLVAAGFMLPLAWGAGALWALMDTRLLRTTVVLLMLTLIAAAAVAL